MKASTFVWIFLISIVLLSPETYGTKNKKKLRIPANQTQKSKPPPPKINVSKPPRERRSLDLTRMVRVQYHEPSWNHSSTKVDQASVIIKDSNTGKTVRVNVTETATDSGVFAGIYSISWKEIQTSSPEIYAVPPEQQGQFVEPTSLSQLKRLPYVFKKDEKDQLIEAFSTREQAERALENYRDQQEKRLKKSDEISESLIETAEKSQKTQEERKLLEEARMREQERLKNLSATERRLAASIQAFNKLPIAEREKRKKNSLAFSEAAMDFYRANQFEAAEERFKKALDIDPTNQDAYFYYGVTLYKRDKFNDSLVYLELAKQGSFNALERDFFKGLNYFRLDEHQRALNTFGEIKKSNDKTFAPTAAFYEGLVKMKLEKYDEAKNHFQEVLDTSSDPALDQSAEDYIERIERLKAFLKQKSKKFFFTGSAGLQYDSNVLLVNSSSPNAGDPSRVGDTRYLTGGSVEYRPVYDEKNELSVKAKGDLIYSSKGDNVAADPLLYSIKVPYRRKTTAWGKGYKLEVVPGYEMLYLDENRSGATAGYFAAYGEKEAYLNSLTVDFLNNLVIVDRHIMGVNLKYRQDKSESKTATGDNDPTATKWSLNWQNIYFLSDKKNFGLIGDLTYAMNTATGKNLTYNRYDISAMLLFPAPLASQGVGGLAYYQATYPDKTPQSRSDNNITATLNFIRPLSDWLGLTVGGSYTDNQSNLSANTYSKYLFMTVLTANWSL